MRILTFKEGLILSICLHLLFAGSLVIYNMNFSQPPPEAVTVEFISPTPSAEAQKQPRQKSQAHTPKQQIVEQAEKPVNKEKPNDTRFLSAYDQKVKEQVVAQNKGDFKNVEKPSADKNKKVMGGERSPEKSKGGEKPKPSLMDLSPEFNPLAIKERQQNQEQNIAKGGDYENSDGGDTSQNNDYIRDIKQGNQTLLNSREFKYYTYYNRIRRQLSHHWEPKVRAKLVRLFRQGRSIASDQDHITKLLIVLNGQGILVKVQVLGASGVRDLDDAAMEAFQSAAPFPNPPKGIIESDGTVKIRWDFVLES